MRVLAKLSFLLVAAFGVYGCASRIDHAPPAPGCSDDPQCALGVGPGGAQGGSASNGGSNSSGGGTPTGPAGPEAGAEAGVVPGVDGGGFGVDATTPTSPGFPDATTPVTPGGP